MRYFMEIAYKGTQYHGWQRQPNALGIQQVIEDKLSILFDEKLEITGSGRTDAGVHCGQQFFHVDIVQKLEDEDLGRMNSFLPGDIVIRRFLPVPDEWHARFDATARSYVYCVLLKPDPFLLDTTYSIHHPLDVEKMNTASKVLLGEHNFQCFSKVKTDVNTFICDVFEASWSEKNHILQFDIRANRFLRGMVRSIVGTLIDVGKGKRTIDEIPALLESKDRKQAGSSVPAKGLSLVKVEYPDSYQI